MNKIKYEVDGYWHITDCPFGLKSPLGLDIQVSDISCQECEHHESMDSVGQIVCCNYPNPKTKKANMDKYTQEDFDNFPIYDGYKQCPIGDYSYINNFPDKCRFAEFSRFGEKSVFGNECIFDWGCFFGSGCVFGFFCRFSTRNSFSDSCEFGVNCQFAPLCTFGENCSFGINCIFDTKCHFNYNCKFGFGCEFSNGCRCREYLEPPETKVSQSTCESCKGTGKRGNGQCRNCSGTGKTGAILTSTMKILKDFSKAEKRG